MNQETETVENRGRSDERGRSNLGIRSGLPPEMQKKIKRT